MIILLERLLPDSEEVNITSRNSNAVLDEANRYFDNKSRAEARTPYNKALNKMKALPFSNKKYVIAQTKFNIAMAY